jgi:hypothetical protein
MVVLLMITYIRYSNKESFATDVKLVFDNCSYYNEDDSEVSVTFDLLSYIKLMCQNDGCQNVHRFTEKH